MRIKELFKFVHERYLIHQRRAHKLPKPWTEDKILQRYRFCNVYRELDKVTIWLRENWRDKNATDKDLWFAMVVARLINWPPSLKPIGYPVPWNKARFLKVMAQRKALGEKLFSSAYMTHAPIGTNKAEHFAEEVFTPMWEGREILRPQKGDLLATFHQRLMGFKEMGSFLSAQVIADTKYYGVLLKAADWKSFAASGPGSRRGLNRVVGNPVHQNWKESDWLFNIQLVGTKLNKLASEACMPAFHAQDVQNCCCEFDKYERARLGEGTPKSLYPGI